MTTAEQSGDDTARDRSVVNELAQRSLTAQHETIVAEVEQILKAALAVFVRSPQVTVEDIVREARISNSTFYRHFRSKQELIDAVTRDAALQLARHLETQLAASSDPVSQVSRWVEILLGQTQDDRFMSAAHAIFLNSRTEPHANAFRVAAVDILRRSLIEPLARFGCDDPDRVSIFVCEFVVGIQTRYIMEEHKPDDREVRRAIDFVVGGIGACVPRPGQG